MIKRSAAVLLHITSLPGDYGYGTLGKKAYEFVDILSDIGFSYWEVLPMNIPDKYDCPYSSASSFFPNPMVIDLEMLLELHLISRGEDQAQKCNFTKEELDERYKDIWENRLSLLEKASERVQPELKIDVLNFCNKNKDINDACKYFAKVDGHDLFAYQFVAYIYDVQWNKLKEYAKSKGIGMIGDVPIYVDFNSSDVFYNPEAFQLENGLPKFVSGVPGDANFDGQKWGHPLYNVKNLEENNYKFLINRFKHYCDAYDLIRIDHFRAFSSYFAIPCDKDPNEGHWEPGVGEKFIKRLIDEVGEDKLIAEDVGGEDEGTQKLLKDFDIPGMDIYQNMNFREPAVNRVVYTGTHDNDTLVGFLNKNEFVGEKALQKANEIIDEVLNSISCLAIFPIQDLLLQDGRYRNNVPGTVGKNWHYRLSNEDFESFRSMTKELKNRLNKYGR